MSVTAVRITGRAAALSAFVLAFGSGSAFCETLASVAVRPVAVAVPASGAGQRRSLRTVSPVYPLDAVEAGLEGTVVVCFGIDADGQVSNAVALSSSHPVFEPAAVAAAAANAFAPVAHGDSPAATTTCLRYRFRL